MILSMTGFGRGIASSGKKKITIELKSLNSKQFDLSMRVPPYFRELEGELRTVLSNSLERGKIDFTAYTENVGGETAATLDIDVMQSYKLQIEDLNRRLGIEPPADWLSILLRLPEALKTDSPELDDDDREAFREALDMALTQFVDFRKKEGEKLYVFFQEKISNIASLLDKIEPFEQERVEKIRAKLCENLERISGVEYDRGRLEQELIYYIEKLDVNEEKLRLRAHLNYFLETMGPDGEKADGQLGKGKKLGFISQEMGREINTLGSKSNNADMQKIVVMMKDELEQIKEQVLNVL